MPRLTKHEVAKVKRLAKVYSWNGAANMLGTSWTTIRRIVNGGAPFVRSPAGDVIKDRLPSIPDPLHSPEPEQAAEMKQKTQVALSSGMSTLQVPDTVMVILAQESLRTGKSVQQILLDRFTQEMGG